MFDKTGPQFQYINCIVQYTHHTQSYLHLGIEVPSFANITCYPFYYAVRVFAFDALHETEVCVSLESRTIAPTDNRSHAKFDRADIRSYDVLTGRTVAPGIGAIVLDWDKFSDPPPPPDGHVFKNPNKWTVNVTCRELTRFYYSHIKNKSCQRARLFECLKV
ncbi:hypothetical protein DPMN_143327 [Dreissena polymorpha]|uniref:Uncharacterized protein n=1 Tax=Dreissena polymorpha TaxID=45954 RepID=A0A9D4GG21_DREPO|nr:hypothetical protein DPMN_143327 [Dreissena polymorpha]